MFAAVYLLYLNPVHMRGQSAYEDWIINQVLGPSTCRPRMDCGLKEGTVENVLGSVKSGFPIYFFMIH
jgi:hypothetical protein